MTSGGSRYGIVVLARSDKRLLDATLESIARLRQGPDAIMVVVHAMREHLFAGTASHPAIAHPIRVVSAGGFDALPLSDGFRAIAPEADIALFVPEGVVLDPGYLAAVRSTAERWQDVVGELDLIFGAVDAEHLAERAAAGIGRPPEPAWSPRRLLRARTLCANTLWVRVEACGNLKSATLPQFSEYLAFASLLDQLRRRGRTRIVASNAALQVRLGSERRSGFEAGRELYGALSRIGELRDRSDVAFAQTQSYLEPRAEKIRLFGEQLLRYVRSPETRAHVGSFIKGMWAARREATASRDRIRDDIRKLG